MQYVIRCLFLSLLPDATNQALRATAHAVLCFQQPNRHLEQNPLWKIFEARCSALYVVYVPKALSYYAEGCASRAATISFTRFL